jgi:hypothetical protein
VYSLQDYIPKQIYKNKNKNKNKNIIIIIIFASARTSPASARTAEGREGEGRGGEERGGEGGRGEGRGGDGRGGDRAYARVRVHARGDALTHPRVYADAGGRPDGHFHPKTSVMTSPMHGDIREDNIMVPKGG